MSDSDRRQSEFTPDSAVLREIVRRTHDPCQGDVDEAWARLGPLTPEQRTKVDHQLAYLFDASDLIGPDGLPVTGGPSPEVLL